ncbi:sensor histidine kinase [Actinoalloteichus hymeniacidonis]|uniref:histidine kinase n=1 Tax=Actinoalloteichus hymeniacidonis TaxID=340345 RepID=A0AAC9HS64_9PSEU|nr:histidine kinase [Actinoalloteichus hymeniacidonis]AOS64488.1 signal transduction histidine kinase [Actinoalloteichus hymeniacidonis]MBB5907441.1 signal transduction histidine kinase [Actinoalloteichus hymeniacidonis]
MTEQLRRRREWIADAGLIALTLLAPALLQPSTDSTATAWLLLACFEAVALAALVVRRRMPITAFLVIVAALVATIVAGAAVGARLSPLAFLSLAVVLYNLGNHGARPARNGVAALVGGLMVGIGLWINWMTVSAVDFRGGPDVLAVLAPMPLAWALGFGARSRRVLLVAAEQRAADATREQHLRAEQAAQQERVRIAREMHDLVAHSLTLLIVHAEALRSRSAELPDWARTQSDGLAVAGRQISGELHDLLRMLRDPADAVPLRPMPDLGDLPALLDGHRAEGGTVEARLRGELESLPRPTQLAGYRIVQESLTNARRHAPGAPVVLTLESDAAGMLIDVVNRPAVRAGTQGAGAGLGLISMRERVDALAGELVVGPTSDGGFRITATLPSGVVGG